MTLSLLLDENISPEIVKQMSAKRPDVMITSVHHWRDGLFKSKRDVAILTAANEESLTLVTYDQKTILPILIQWGHKGVDHSGVFFLDDRSISSNMFGGIIRALAGLFDASHNEDWNNRVEFIKTG